MCIVNIFLDLSSAFLFMVFIVHSSVTSLSSPSIHLANFYLWCSHLEISSPPQDERDIQLVYIFFTIIYEYFMYLQSALM